MSITGAIVLYAVTWFMTLFCVLPYRTVSQDEAKDIVPGTPPGAPASDVMRRKAWITTLIATPIWVVMVAVILSGWITVEDLDWFDRIRD
jgi:predicted secreted protein